VKKWWLFAVLIVVLSTVAAAQHMGGGIGRIISSPVVISGISSGTPTSTGATITWTNTPTAEGQACYGLTTSYGTCSTRDSSNTVSDSATISGLAASTLYHYQINATAVGSTQGFSADQTFTTANAIVQLTDNFTSASVASISNTITSSVPIGTLVVVFVIDGNTSLSGASVTDARGNTYTLASGVLAGGGGSNGEVFYSFITTALVNGDAITYNTGGGVASAHIGFSAISASGYLSYDPATTASATGNSGTYSVMGAGTAGAANEINFGFAVAQYNINTATGWVQPPNTPTSPTFWYPAAQLNSGTSPLTFTGTAGGSGFWSAIIVSFSPTAIPADPNAIVIAPGGSDSLRDRQDQRQRDRASTDRGVIPVEVTQTPWRYTTFWDWLDHWQTLIAGGFALLAGVGTVVATIIIANRQIAASREEAKRVIAATCEQTATTVNLEQTRKESEARAFRAMFEAAMVRVLADAKDAKEAFRGPGPHLYEDAYAARKRFSKLGFNELRAACVRQGTRLTEKFLELENEIDKFASQTRETSTGPWGEPNGLVGQLADIENKAKQLREEAVEQI
jgi:hypothetical protein